MKGGGSKIRDRRDSVPTVRRVFFYFDEFPNHNLDKIILIGSGSDGDDSRPNQSVTLKHSETQTIQSIIASTQLTLFWLCDGIVQII